MKNVRRNEQNLSEKVVYNNIKNNYSFVTASVSETFEENSVVGIKNDLINRKLRKKGLSLKKQAFILFATTNLISGMMHIEAHTQRIGFTADEFDGYFGTCKLLQRHIKKFGKENFSRRTIGVFNDRFSAECEEYRLKRKDDSYKNDVNFYNSASPKERKFGNRSDEDYKSFKKFGGKLYKGMVSYPKDIKNFHLGSEIEICVAGRNLKVIAGDHVIGKDASLIVSILKTLPNYEGSLYQVSLIVNGNRPSFYITGGKINRGGEDSSHFQKALREEYLIDKNFRLDGEVISHLNVHTFEQEDYSEYLDILGELRICGYHKDLQYFPFNDSDNSLFRKNLASLLRKDENIINEFIEETKSMADKVYFEKNKSIKKKVVLTDKGYRIAPLTQ